MATYFGCQTTDYDNIAYGPAISITAVAYTCPGSGSQNIQELSAYCMRSGGTAVNVRLGVYTTAGALVAEGTGEVAVTGSSNAWQGHMSQSAVKAAGGSSPGVLTGGTNYYLVFACDGTVSQALLLGGAATYKYTASDYTGGMPSDISGSFFTTDAGAGSESQQTIRCGVDAAPAAGVWFPKRNAYRPLLLR